MPGNELERLVISICEVSEAKISGILVTLGRWMGTPCFTRVKQDVNIVEWLSLLTKAPPRA